MQIRFLWLSALVSLVAVTHVALLRIPYAFALESEGKTFRVALVQFDSKPGQVQKNLEAMERIAREAVQHDAELVMFHELATSDYMDDMGNFAEPIPQGPSCQAMEKLAKELRCYISFGMPEKNEDRLHIAQVFVGPDGFIYRYRKTWLWRSKGDEGFRNEWARYNPGTGPELFEIAGIQATCMICADADAPRCIEQARTLNPQLVFFPVNRGAKSFHEYPAVAAQIGAPMLVTNRIGDSHGKTCVGGCTVYAPDGQLLAVANRNQTEEILYYTLTIQQR